MPLHRPMVVSRVTIDDGIHRLPAGVKGQVAPSAVRDDQVAPAVDDTITPMIMDGDAAQP
jgi:hypothetical protein